MNAEEALSLYAESLARDGRSLPTAFGVDLARRSEIAPDMRDHVVALIGFMAGPHTPPNNEIAKRPYHAQARLR